MMNPRDYHAQIVWIIGASSGIGLSLAQELSSRGATLALSARRQGALETLKIQLGEQHTIHPMDITDIEQVLITAQTISVTHGRIDRIIFMAAAYAPMNLDDLDIAITKGIVDTNLTGAFNLVHATLPIFKSQINKGQLALCGSVAGYVGLPGGQPYSATKAAIINLAESLFIECQDILDVKLISPGFVQTPLTDKNDFKMPMIIKSEQAARAIADGLLTSRFEIHFPKKFTLLLKMLSILPYGLTQRLLKKIKL